MPFSLGKNRLPIRLTVFLSLCLHQLLVQVQFSEDSYPITLWLENLLLPSASPKSDVIGAAERQRISFFGLTHAAWDRVGIHFFHWNQDYPGCREPFADYTSWIKLMVEACPFHPKDNGKKHVCISKQVEGANMDVSKLSVSPVSLDSSSRCHR